MKIQAFAFVGLALLLTVPVIRADQYGCFPRAVANRALNFLPPGAVVICHGVNKITKLWRVEEAVKTAEEDDGLVEIRLFVRPLATTSGAQDDLAAARWEPTAPEDRDRTLQHIDLAYLFVRHPDGSFRVLAEVLGLPPRSPPYEPPIRLPAALLESLRDSNPPRQ